MSSGSPRTMRATPSRAISGRFSPSALSAEVTSSTSSGVANFPPSSLMARPTRFSPSSIASVRLVLQRRFHDGVIDADLLKLWIHLAENRILARRPPDIGDLRQPAMNVRQMHAELVEHRIAAPHEHPAVPVVAAGFNIAIG